MSAEVEAPVEVVADPVLLGSREQARAALLEITDAATIGADEGYEAHEAHVLTLFFECRLPGYPGWRWAATLARVDEEAPVTVLEVELLPGAGAVVAPEWVPWSERLAQYRETQARQAAEEAAAAEAAADELRDEDEIAGDEDLLENDFSDFDDDLDGADIDDLDGGDSSADSGDADDDDDDDDEDRADESDDTELFADDESDDDDADDDESDGDDDHDDDERADRSY
ncbi:DUF3027 domain-containing protein [Leucobacter chromiireducens subsp. chromiireducens]|uniref:DUF3027 domain-containing protein n=1 Tax=Leucobacter chromiireducens subsp. chromiireducens TaxID=660067 RepID=A0ABS1SMP1_9MICO|nr:DUF3027 domain-containing protein [Leucobacter chromiireducens subsp. chromiireducens]